MLNDKIKADLKKQIYLNPDIILNDEDKIKDLIQAPELINEILKAKNVKEYKVQFKGEPLQLLMGNEMSPPEQLPMGFAKVTIKRVE